MKKIIALLLQVVFITTVFSKDFKGYFNYNYNEASGKVTLTVNELDKEFLLVTYFGSGLGSNDIGFDRGKITGQRLVKFTKYGNRIALMESNTYFTAKSNNAQEVKVAKDAFASAILYVFRIEGDSAGYKIDITPMLTDDLSGIASNLKDQKQGSYKLDKNTSVVIPDEMHAFPQNIEFESWLSFTGEATGEYLKQMPLNKDVLSMRQHISMVALPDAGYKPRVYHPFSGYFDMSFFDYATPIYSPIEKRVIYRHRLEKKNPQAEKSEAVEPIIYYVDNGCPEPIKSALIEGASWWNQAFEAAGFINAFQVKELPLDAHPLDVRYNTIQWVHRSTRGWSYGSNIHDPRTGEIIKGHVTLGSLRVRQDFMIAQGLLSLYEGKSQDHNPMLAMALARLKQLSAHEVGHTIGLAHNFAASGNDLASVMDYPHPMAQLVDDKINLNKAYDDKIGIWDKRAIIYGYKTFSGNEDQALLDIIQETKSMGLNYLSDPDSRPDGSAAYNSHLWDNGKDAVTELKRVMAVRKKAIEKFGMNSIPQGTPLSELEKVFVPLYFAQRYQVEASSKIVGGMNYNYAVKGDADVTNKPVAIDIQKNTLRELLSTISPENLVVPSSIRELLMPNAYGYNFTRESFANETGYGFDQVAVASAAIDHLYSLLLNPQRLARINNQNLMQLTDYFKMIYDQIAVHNYTDVEALKLSLIREKNFVLRLIGLAQNTKKTATASAAIYILNNVVAGNLTKSIAKAKPSETLLLEQKTYLSNIIARWQNYETIDIPAPATLPPGQPIGCE
jgi:hypothetical protein